MVPPFETLFDVVKSHPGSDKRQLARMLARNGHSASAHEVNVRLYSHPGAFRWVPDGAYRRLWYVVPGAPKPAEARAQRQPGTESRSPVYADLHAWQRRALDAWRRSGRIGVVEAVTGAGKTRLALAAAQDELDAGGKVVVLLHTLSLMDQWEREVVKHLRLPTGRLRVGRLGGGRNDSLTTCGVLIATVQMGYRQWLLPEGATGLLIADECHHYGAAGWQSALEPRFRHRLGLTATYEREDLGVEQYLDPYFGGVRYSALYEEVLTDDVIAHFKVAFVGVTFIGAEADRYEEASSWASKHRNRLIRVYGVTAEPFAEFIKEVNHLAKSNRGEASKYAGFYLSAFTKRRSILSNASAKLQCLAELAPAIRHADRTILFTQTKRAARDAASALQQQRINAGVLAADMELAERRKVMAAFEDGMHELVAAPKLLDEGVDIVSADLGIVLASSRSRRQMIQRMGRLIRKKPDGRLARMAIVFVEGTIEDPTEGAHEDFLDVVTEAADDVRVFRSAIGSSAVVRYLDDWASKPGLSG